MAVPFKSAFTVALLASGLACAAEPATTNAPKMAPAGQPIPIQDFIRHAQFNRTRISPNGEYLAITAQEDGIVYLAVLRTSDLALIRRTTLPDDKSIGDFYWVGPDRLMFTAIRNIGRFAAPVGTGEWYAMDADGGRQRNVISYSARDATSAGLGADYRDSYDMLDPLPFDEKKVIMSVDHYTGPGTSQAEVMEVDTISGQRRSLARAPRLNCEMVLDAKKLPRFANCFDSKDAAGKFEENTELYVRDDNDKWRLLHRSVGTSRRVRALGAAHDGRIYAEQDDRKAPAAFGLLDPATGNFTKLTQDPVAAPEGYITSSDGDTVIGVVTAAGKPKVELVDANSPDVPVYLSLAKSFPGRFVQFTSATLDGSKILFVVIDDNSPVELYLYDKATNQNRFLLRDRDWLDPKRMATVQPFSFKARDGVEMYGYLTIPNGRKPENLPMIVNPHGGPIGPRDDWGFNWETQMFASRGYLVLQLNYRGSGGYGQGFQDMGHGEWGGKMQDDLTDVTRWAVQKGYADPERICIYGGSYGGYAALMGVAKEPDLYRCAVGYVGVYDLVSTMYKKGDIRERKSGKRFLEHTLGTDVGERRDNSPAFQAAKIKAPVFLAAGLADQRAPYQHTEKMRDALAAAGHPADVVILQEKEGHGFYKEANNLNLYTKMLAFFDRYIGDRRGHVEVETVEKAPPAAPAEPVQDDGGNH
jgi:dipeptidyl aminopeptidase/acylaminoacyl peptidase